MVWFHHERLEKRFMVPEIAVEDELLQLYRLPQDPQQIGLVHVLVGKGKGSEGSESEETAVISGRVDPSQRWEPTSKAACD